jgi:hypothetical protein
MGKSAFIKGFLMLICAFIVLSSCSANAEELIPAYENDLSSDDLGGFTVKWAWTAVDTAFGYVPGTNFSDMALERKKETEKKLNCKIDVDYNSNAPSLYQASVMTGTHYCDLLTAGNTISAMIRGGYFAGLSSFIDLNDTFKWGSPLTLSSAAWKDDVYAVCPASWPELFLASASYPIVVNESLVSKYGLEDPRVYVENGTWNWDKFEECIQAFTVQDGENRVYGFMTHPPYFGVSMVLSNGVTFTQVENGTVSCGFYSENGRAALERARSIMFETCSDCIHPETECFFQKGVDLFLANAAVMYTSRGDDLLSGTDSIIFNFSDIGIIPYPYGPNGKPGVYLGYNQGLYYATALTLNSSDADASVKILSEMFEPFKGYETKEKIIDYMSEQIFSDRRDAEIYYSLLENTEYGYYNEGGRKLVDNIFVSSKSVSEILESFQSQYDDLIESYMIPVYEGLSAVYSD